MQTDDNYQRRCHFMSTFFRNVAYRGFAPEPFGCHDRCFFPTSLPLHIVWGNFFDPKSPPFWVLGVISESPEYNQVFKKKKESYGGTLRDVVSWRACIECIILQKIKMGEMKRSVFLRVFVTQESMWKRGV